MKFLKYFFFFLPSMFLMAETAHIHKVEKIDDEYLFLTLEDQRTIFIPHITFSLEEGDEVELEGQGKWTQVIKNDMTTQGFFYTTQDCEVLQVEEDEIYLTNGVLIDPFWVQPALKVGDQLTYIKNNKAPQIGHKIYFRFNDKIVKAFLEAIAEDAVEQTLIQSYLLTMEGRCFDKEDGETETIQHGTYINHMSSGEVIIAEKNIDRAFPIYIAKKGDQERAIFSDKRYVTEGLAIFKTSTDKITRTVVSSSHEIIFDDGFSLPKLTLQDASFNFQIPPSNDNEAQSISVSFDFSQDFSLKLVIDSDDELVDLSIHGPAELLTFVGLGQFQVGEVYDCYPLGEDFKALVRTYAGDLPGLDPILDQICLFHRI